MLLPGRVPTIWDSASARTEEFNSFRSLGDYQLISSKFESTLLSAVLSTFLSTQSQT